MCSCFFFGRRAGFALVLQSDLWSKLQKRQDRLGIAIHSRSISLRQPATTPRE